MSLKQNAQDVVNLVRRGSYFAGDSEVSIASEVLAAQSGSRIYTPDDLAVLRKRKPTGSHPQVEVVGGTTQQVAQAMAGHGRVALLNFASGRNPGGGFLNGAKAQEEDLCRCSALFSTILKHRQYYDANKEEPSLLYTDHAIFSPDVPFFKTRGTGELLAEPFVASVITAPAPNTKPYLANSGDPVALEACFERRWRNVLAIAIDASIPNILLGAWGCGAFGGDPLTASQTAKKALADFAPAFERVVFAIPKKGKQSKHNLTVFANTFGVDW